MESKISVLKADYPTLYLNYLNENDMKEKIEEYIAECFKLREGTAQKYSLYIHGYVVPTIEL